MTAQLIEDGHRNLVIKFSDAGPDTVDVSALNPPCEELVLMEVTYDNPSDGEATISWDATADTVAYTMNGHAETACFERYGGIQNNAGAGKTGDAIYAGVVGGTVVATFRKVRPQIPL